MNLNDIKKKLYKEEPDAILMYVDGSGARYNTVFDDGVVVFFQVPANEMGTTSFYPVMEAKYLIRWITE